MTWRVRLGGLGLLLAACGGEGSLADLELPPEGVPWLAQRYTLRAEILATDCAPGGLVPFVREVLVDLVQDGEDVRWTQPGGRGQSTPWILNGRMCPEPAAGSGWRLHLAGGRALRLSAGEASCRIDAILPASARLASSPACDAPGIRLHRDRCAGLLGEAVSVRMRFDSACGRAGDCELLMRWTAEPLRGDPRDPDFDASCTIDSADSTDTALRAAEQAAALTAQVRRR